MNKQTGLSPDTLKIIALFSMLTDHISYGLIRELAVRNPASPYYTVLNNIADVMTYFGRIAFPVFAYLLVQGFVHTKSRAKYAVNLLIFSVISELPFDFYFFKKIYWGHQNVMPEFLTGLTMLCIAEYVSNEFFGVDFTGIKPVSGKSKPRLVHAVLASVLITGVFCVAAFFIHPDYDSKGIILIAAFYMLYKNRELMMIVCPLLFILSFFPVSYLRGSDLNTSFNSMISEIPAIVGFYLISRDNGIRKIKGKRKYIFYAFYPLHLIILLLIRIYCLSSS